MKKISKKAFSIIEVLVAILIFALWITAVYMLISSSIKANTYTKNQIIAANLAREELELIRNIRDSNYKTLNVWHKKNPKWNNSDNHTDPSVYFIADKYYKIENDYNRLAPFPIKVKEITNFWEWIWEINWKMQDYRLCLDSKNRYTYDCSWTNKKTIFYRFLKVEKVENKDWTIDNALKVTSKVIWYANSYHQLEIPTIITDWKRL